MGLDDEERAFKDSRRRWAFKPRQFLEDLARIAIGKPLEETREFMIGDLLRRAKVAVPGKGKKVT